MYPNPQEALPLPPRPSFDHYRKRAKDLVKASRSADPEAILAWAAGWEAIEAHAEKIAGFARERLTRIPNGATLANAQFVIARSHGFTNWPAFAAHVRSLELANSTVSAFEIAVDALVDGEEATLARLLREHPNLPRVQSTREHRGTLLIYTSANGVEGYRQKSPKNAAAIAERLLAAGAEVDATAEVYHGKCTTLGLVATSEPPRTAGVQLDVIDVLLRHGARVDLPDMAGNSDGNTRSLVHSCLANGQPAAAEYLVERGAPLDLVGAAGLGHLDVLGRFFAPDGRLTSGATTADFAKALSLASAYGRTDAVGFLLDHGIAVDAELKDHGAGHTALHVAAFHGHGGIVEQLLARGARVDIVDKTWKTPPLSWALTGWARREADSNAYYEVVARLVRGGAAVSHGVLEWENVRADPKMQAALKGRLQT